MNKELVDNLRLDAGISRTVDSSGKVVTGLICINRDGNVIDPLDGLTKFAELIMFECIDAVIEGDPSSKMIISPERRAIVDDIKVRLGWND